MSTPRAPSPTKRRLRAGGRMALLAALALLAGCGGEGTGKAPAGATGSFRIATELPQQLAGRPAPRIRLRDARGGIVDTKALSGTPYAVTFLYTNCPDVCPLIGAEIAQALGKLGRTASRFAIVAVTVDPRHDTAAAVRDWLELHREPANFHYGIGDRAALAPVWKAYYAAPQIPGDPRSAHTASVWLVDARGRWRARLPAGAPVDPADLAHDFRVLGAGS